MFLQTLCLQILAMFVLALSKDKHFKQIFQRFPSDTEALVLRVMGTLICLLGLSFLEPLGWSLVALYGVSQISIGITATSIFLREKSRNKRPSNPRQTKKHTNS